MESLGIYGASFVGIGSQYTAEMAAKGWPDLLKRSYNVTNYGVGGSSLYYSYKNYLNTYNKHDKCIFIVTPCGRAPKNVFEHKGNLYGFNNLSTVEAFLKSKKDIDVELEYHLEHLKYYYAHLSDYSIDLDMHTLMIEKLLSVKSNTVFICVHKEETESTRNTLPSLLMQDYQELMVRSLKLDLLDKFKANNFIPYIEKNIVCHFTEEVNVLVAEHMEQMLLKKEVTIPQTLPHKYNWEHYYGDGY